MVLSVKSVTSGSPIFFGFGFNNDLHLFDNENLNWIKLNYLEHLHYCRIPKSFLF
jgi:hypothetical protein